MKPQKNRQVSESIEDKLAKARKLKAQKQYYEAIEAFHKVIFLEEDPSYLLELAEIYEKLLDFSSAIVFYRRVNQLKKNEAVQEKIKTLTKIHGLELLELGGCRNILEGTEFKPFIRRYPLFHASLKKKIHSKPLFSDYLESCLAYLEMNHRQSALNELDNCLMIDQKDVDVIVMKAFLNWSMLEKSSGYKEFWHAYSIDQKHQEVQIFVETVQSEINTLYKEAKYDLIEQKVDKCKIKVKKGLQMHPYHTQFLILSAYLHRTKEQYEAALSDLELANKTLQDKNFEEELRSQIALTYNEMGIYLFRQGKFSESITLFTQGLTFKPKDWGMLTNRGDCYRSLNEYLKALENYLQAFEIEKKNEDLNFRIACIYNLRGVALFNSKNYEHAQKEFDQAIKFSPKSASFHLSKAKCLIQLDRKSEALKSLVVTLELDKTSEEAKKLFQEMKQPGEVRRQNRKVIQLPREKY